MTSNIFTKRRMASVEDMFPSWFQLQKNYYLKQYSEAKWEKKWTSAYCKYNFKYNINKYKQTRVQYS